MATIDNAGGAIPLLPENNPSKEVQSQPVKYPMPESLKQAFEFTEAWASENKATLQQLPIGKAVKLSRQEITRLKSEDKLSKRLTEMLNTANFTNSIAIVKVGEGQFRFVAMHHKTNAEREAKVFAAGGVNKLNRMQNPEGVEFLNRQNIGTSTLQLEMIQRQKKADEALKGAPHIARPFATNIQLPKGSLDLGVKPIKGSIVQKILNSEKAIGAVVERGVVTGLDKPLPPEQGIRYMHHISEAIGFMHDHNMVHRDLKIENLLFDMEGNCYVTDFDTFVDLNNPMTVTEKHEMMEEEVPTNELERLDNQGSPHLVAPWIASIYVKESFNKASIASVAANKKAEEAKQDGDMSRLVEANSEMYKPADCYDFALMGFMMITGKYPDYVSENASRGFAVLTAIKKNTRDDVWKPMSDPEELPPQNTNAINTKEELDSAAKAGGYPQELVDLIYRGLSSDPAEVPTIQEFRAVLSKLDQPPKNQD